MGKWTTQSRYDISLWRGETKRLETRVFSVVCIESVCGVGTWDNQFAGLCLCSLILTVPVYVCFMCSHSLSLSLLCFYLFMVVVLFSG